MYGAIILFLHIKIVPNKIDGKKGLNLIDKISREYFFENTMTITVKIKYKIITNYVSSILKKATKTAFRFKLYILLFP